MRLMMETDKTQSLTWQCHLQMKVCVQGRYELGQTMNPKWCKTHECYMHQWDNLAAEHQQLQQERQSLHHKSSQTRQEKFLLCYIIVMVWGSFFVIVSLSCPFLS